MPTRALAVAAMAVVVALLIAGCSGKPAAPSPSPTSPPSASGSSSSRGLLPNVTVVSVAPAFGLGDCTNFGGVFPLARDQAVGMLPPGFEPVAASSDPTGSHVVLYVLAVRCGSSFVATRSTGPAQLLYAELAVTPPKEQQLHAITDCTVPLLFTTSNPELASALILGLGAATLTLRGAVVPTGTTSLDSGAFVVYGVQDKVLRSTLLASSVGGSAQDAAVTLQASGAGAIDAAQPAARGFSVSGFSLAYVPQGPAVPAASH
jgi:hypothetical protein